MLELRRELGLRVAVVAFAPARSLARYAERLRLDDVVVLADPDRGAYRAFGFGRGSVGRVWFDPRVWLRYAALFARGRRPEPPQEDTLQLGGDVLVDGAGRVRWVHRSTGPEDRPSTAAVRAAVERMRARAAVRRGAGGDAAP